MFPFGRKRENLEDLDDDELYERYVAAKTADEERGEALPGLAFMNALSEERQDALAHLAERAEGDWPSDDEGADPYTGRLRPTVWDDQRRAPRSPPSSAGDRGDDDGLAEDGRATLSRAAGVHAFVEMDALRHDGRFTDVVLACDGGENIPCHRVVLCASSAYFRSLLVERSDVGFGETLAMLPTLSFHGVAAAVDYCYGTGVRILAEPPASGAPPRTWRHLPGALRALRHFKMGLAEEHVWRCCIRVLDAFPEAYALAVDLHSLADDFDCAPLKHKAWHAALEMKPKALTLRALGNTAQSYPAEAHDVDDATLLYPFDDDGADPEPGADLAEPPYDAATVVGAWHRKLKAIRDDLGPDPPDAYGDLYGSGSDGGSASASDGGRGGGDDDGGAAPRHSMARSASPDSATSDQ